MIVADTDVLIDFFNARGPHRDLLRASTTRGQLMVTAITRFEVLSGARSAKAQSTVLDFLRPLRTLPLDHLAADEAASIRRTLELQGLPIGLADSLIAGIVRLHGYPLLTRNRKHFERVDGLILL